MKHSSSGQSGRSLDTRKLLASDISEKEGGPKAEAAAERKRAWERINAVTSKVVDREPYPEKTNREDEEAIADAIREFRRKHA